ncbi:caveolin-1-like [Ruditapes philippinarum]|uniref:caveolin-1-like n=1 Tax=Ruditapes philippinarum TaxID=129788 RepID=UPI00295AB3C6|nr:caveolin-1-like [Ruditapes philippinarum]
MDTVDVVNRDPNNINDHLKVAFEDVLAEPDGVHSLDCVWKLSYTCFTCWLGLTYKISTLCFGICIAAEWACEFAETAFYHIWFITPFLRMLEINCSVLKKIHETICGCCLEPCCEAFGTVFKHLGKN